MLKIVILGTLAGLVIFPLTFQEEGEKEGVEGTTKVVKKIKIAPLQKVSKQLPKKPNVSIKKVEPQVSDLEEEIIDLPEYQEDAGPFERRQKGRSWARSVLEDNGLSGALVEPWFADGTPEKIVFRKSGVKRIFKNKVFGIGSGKGEKKTLNISDEQSALDVKSQREEASRKVSSSHTRRRKSNDENKKPEDTKKPDNDKKEVRYSASKFIPGTRDNIRDKIKKPDNINYSIKGPDFHMTMIDPSDEEALRKLRALVVSLGHGGTLILEVKDGYIVDGEGPDFVIYENVLKIAGGLLYQEFAKVYVSMNKKSGYRSFDCKPDEDILAGCAGLVPTDDGGDQFDLATIGMNKIKYIKIKDTGNNFNNYGVNTEGFDFDALEMINTESE